MKKYQMPTLTLLLSALLIIPAMGEDSKASDMPSEPVLQSRNPADISTGITALEALENELTGLQAEKSAFQKEMVGKLTELGREKHDAEYNDPGCSKLRKEIVEHERELVRLREELAVQQKLVPAIKRVEKQRKEIIEKMQAMQEQERLIRNEIRSLKMRRGNKD